MIAIDLSKHKSLTRINFTSNLDRTNNTRAFFILEEAKKTVLDFSQGTVKVSSIYCTIILIFLI